MAPESKAITGLCAPAKSVMLLGDANTDCMDSHRIVDTRRFLSTDGGAGSEQKDTAARVIDSPADGRGNYARQLPPRAQAGTGGSVTTGNGISYHNGPVMRSGVNIYYIWYGNWAQDPTANAILTDLASNLGGSPYFNINTTYGDTMGNVPNTVRYGGAVTDLGSLGTSVSDNGIWTLVSNAIKTFGADPNGVYFVLTAPYVAETSGFLSQYWARHTYNYFGSTKIKYAFVGNPAAGMGSCSVQATSPNGDAQADAMATGIAHELEEAATDPELTAWYDSTGARTPTSAPGLSGPPIRPRMARKPT